MKGQERIFMFTANIALTTKKRPKHKATRKAFENSREARTKGIKLIAKSVWQLKGGGSCGSPVQYTARAGPAVASPGTDHGYSWVHAAQFKSLGKESKPTTDFNIFRRDSKGELIQFECCSSTKRLNEFKPQSGTLK